jgi:hypothetical protein
MAAAQGSKRAKHQQRCFDGFCLKQTFNISVNYEK